MTKTVFGDAYQIIPRRSHGHYYMQETQLRAKLGGTSIASDGSLISTVEDMAKWDAAVRAGKFLSAAGWKTVWSPAKLASGRERAYGMGWNLTGPFGVPYVGPRGQLGGLQRGVRAISALLWTQEGRLAQLSQRPDPAPAGPKAVGR